MKFAFLFVWIRICQEGMNTTACYLCVRRLLRVGCRSIQLSSGAPYLVFWAARYIKPWKRLKFRHAYGSIPIPLKNGLYLESWKVMLLRCSLEAHILSYCHCYDYSISQHMCVHSLFTDILYNTVPCKATWKYKYNLTWPHFLWPFSYWSCALYNLLFTL